MSLSNNPTILAAAPRPAALADWLRARSPLGVSLVAFVLVVLIGVGHGGYFPTAWGWCVLAFTWIVGLSLTFADRLGLRRIELAFLAALALLTAWTALSIIWSSDVESSVLQVQRAMIYVSAAVAMLLVVRAAAVAHLLGGLLAGVTWLCVLALASRLFPGVPPGVEEVTQKRLAGTISYANTLGLFAVMGALLALGIALYGRRLAGRAAAAAVLPILLTTAYFTFSRGAAAALAVGLIAAIAVDGTRLKILTAGVLVALPGVVAVWLAYGQAALTRNTAPAVLIADEGRHLATVLVALTIASAAIALLIGWAEQRVRVPRQMRLGYGLLLAGLVVFALAGFVIDRGGPGPLIEETYQGIDNNRVPVNQEEANNLNTRLANIGTSSRVNFWRAALREHEQHPLIGSGAGTYEQFWHRNRRVTEDASDGHSIYLETLGELGWPGLIFVIALLAVPLGALRRARRHPIVVGAAGAYVAFIFRAGIDWDWEMPSVTLLALACAVALMAAARDGGRAGYRELGPRVRMGGLAAGIALALFAIVGLVGNRALSDATRERAARNYGAAQSAARDAVRWAPWSAHAQEELGIAEAGLGHLAEGRERLQKAASMSSDDWRIWYHLGILSRGSQRQRAFVRAATLNPLQPEIKALRERGVRLPPAPKLE